MPGVFDEKVFNAEVFGKYIETLPNLKKNELLKSKALRPRPDLKAMMSAQTGGNYITTPLKGIISGAAPLNYDGSTDMTSQKTKTYTHSRIVVGRMQSWVEDDFAFDITGGQDFLENVASQVSDYWNEVDQDTLLAVLEGIFSMTGAANLKFVNGHTTDITATVNATDATLNGKLTATSVNTAMQKALGDNKGKLSLVIMHSVVATGLENLQLLSYMKFNDANGLQREIGLATLNGRLVLIDDGMPTADIAATYALTTDTELDSSKTYYTRSGSAGSYVYTAVTSPLVGEIATYYELTAEAYTTYTTYILGDGAIEYTDIGAKVPYEVDRDPKTNGGQDTLYSRQRKCFAPFGISYTSTSVVSPTDADLKNGSNWSLVTSVGTVKDYIDHKSIPIARVISRG